MSIYSNVTEKELENLRKLAEQQKEQIALKIKNRILKQTHDDKLAESFSPITKRLDLVENNKGEKIGEVIKKLETPAIQDTQSETPATENTQSQSETPAIENTQTQPGVLYDVSLENTLTNMKDKEKGFFKITEDQNGQRFWNGLPIQTPRDSIVEVEGKKFKITTNLQNVFSDTTGISLKNLDKTESQTYKNF